MLTDPGRDLRYQPAARRGASATPGIRGIEKVVLTAMLLIGLASHGVALWSHSLTADAAYHLLAGDQALRRGLNTVNLEHPPLPKMVAALPLLAYDSPFEVARASNAVALSQAIYSEPALTLRAMRLGRIALYLVFSIPFLLACFLLGRRLGGPRLGWALILVSMLSYSVFPALTILTTDSAVAAGFMLTLVGCCRHVDAPGRGTTLWIGSALGLALASKFSAVLLLPTVGLAIALAPRRRLARRVLDLLAILGLAIGFVALTYACANHGYESAEGRDAIVRYCREEAAVLVADEMRPWEPRLLALERHSPLLAQYLTGFLSLAIENRVAVYPSYAFGAVTSHGWWWYFPVLVAAKTPLAILFALAAALCWMLRRGRGALAAMSPSASRRLLLVALTFGVFWATALSAKFNWGIRHLLPVLPLLYLPAAWWCARSWRRLSSIGAVLALELVLVAPLWMSVTNTWWLGEHNPTRHAFATANLEYHQNHLFLARELERRGIERVGIVFPTASQAELDVFVPGARVVTPGDSLAPGWYAVSIAAEQYIPAFLAAEPGTLYRQQQLRAVARRWLPLLEELERRGEDHGYVAGSFHLIRVEPRRAP